MIQRGFAGCRPSFILGNLIPDGLDPCLLDPLEVSVMKWAQGSRYKGQGQKHLALWSYMPYALCLRPDIEYSGEC